MNTKDLQNILRSAIIGAIFAVPFIALIVSGSLFFPYITGKALVFRTLVEIMFFAWLILASINKDYRPRSSFVLWSVSGAFLLMGLATLFGENVGNSFFSNFERMEGFLTQLHLWAYFVVLISVIKTEKLWQYFLQTQIGVSVLVGIYGLLQLAEIYEIMQGGARLDATLGNAGYLGGYMLMSFFITFYMLVIKWKYKWWRYSYLGIMFLQVFILFDTATRGSLLGLIGALILGAIIFVIYSPREHYKIKQWSLVFLTSLVILIGGFWLAKDTDFIQTQPVLSRFANISLEDNTTQSRFLIWEMSLQAGLERPLLGWGPENFPLVFNKYYDPKMYAQEPWFDRSHNVVFDWLVASGFLGLIAYLAIFGSAVYYLLFAKVKSNDKREPVFKSWEKASLVAFLAGYFFQNLFIFDNIVSYYIFFMVLALIHVLQTTRTEAKIVFETTPQIVNKNSLITFTSLTVIIFMVVFYISVAKPTLAASGLVQALTLANQGEIESSFNNFEKVLKYKTLGENQTKEQLLGIATAVVSSPSVPDELKLKFRNLVAETIDPDLTQGESKLVRQRLIYADYLLRLGQLTKAVDQFEQARSLAPKKQMILSGLASLYLLQEKETEALALAEESLLLEPRNDEARKMYALIALKVNDLDLALEILQPISDTLAIDDERFIKYFVAEKRFDLVKDIYRLKVSQGQIDTQTWTNLIIAVYLSEGEEQALLVVDEAVEANEDFAIEAENIRGAIKQGAIKINQ